MSNGRSIRDVLPGSGRGTSRAFLNEKNLRVFVLFIEGEEKTYTAEERKIYHCGGSN
jgi:hypothetical protein